MTEFLTQGEFERNQAQFERVQPLLRRMEACPKAVGSFRMTWNRADGSYVVEVCGRVFCGGPESSLEAAVLYAESL